jgi:hypothetical protein
MSRGLERRRFPQTAQVVAVALPNISPRRRRRLAATRRLLGATLGVAVLTCTLQAQSLGDIARKEEERRRTVAAPGKVYTNEMLRVPPLPPAAEGEAADRPATPATPFGETRAVARETDAEGASAEPSGSAEAVDRDEGWWRTRAQEQREALRRAELFAESLQTRINVLTADFTARDDPAQRDLIAVDRQRGVGGLARLR